MPSVEVIAIGTELLLGEIADTNTQYIARTIRDLGINLYRTSIVGDNKDRIASLVKEAMNRSDIIITTGGLGPTVDDPTREALSKAADTHLVFHPELWENIRSRFFKAGRVPGENQKRQAYIPDKAIIFNNPVGTAPAFLINKNNNVIIALPGVPAEMKTILDQSVISYLKQHFNLTETLKVRILHTSGAGEGWIDEKISDLEELINPTIGLAAHAGIVDIRITAKAADDEKAEELLFSMETEIRNRLGDYIFGSDATSLEETAMDASVKCGWTVTSVETGTGDLLSQRLSTLQNSAYLGSNQSPFDNISLKKIVEIIRNDGKAEIVLGLSVIVSGNNSTIQIVIYTPRDEYDRQIHYSGHPKNAPILGVNLILDQLRRMMASTSSSE
ncbi:MAG: CinA family nicotinamide mononucleotide deamidase-related protein [Chloroflexota bacterium]